MTFKCSHCHRVLYIEHEARNHICKPMAKFTIPKLTEQPVTNTQIKPVTKYEVNGHLFDTEEDAQQYLCRQQLAQFFCESEELFFSSDSSDVDDIAQYCIARKERLIHLLSFIK